MPEIPSSPPRLNGVAETCLYVTDLIRARVFYREVIGLEEMLADHRFAAFRVAEGHVLLLFVSGATLEPVEIPGGIIPPHDGWGQQHAGLAIGREELDGWRRWLGKNGVEIESEVNWPRGGISLYFRDPEGNLLELLTPGVWPNY